MSLSRITRQQSAKDDPTLLVGELIEQLSGPEDSVLRRDFASFIGWLLRRRARNPKIPIMTDLKEVQTMLTERRLDWWEEWMEEGKVKGLAEGEAKGLAQGLAEGRLKGEAILLQRLLVRRFGPLSQDVEARLAAASEAQLMEWAERILDARSLEELLKE